RLGSPKARPGPGRAPADALPHVRARKRRSPPRCGQGARGWTERRRPAPRYHPSSRGPHPAGFLDRSSFDRPELVAQRRRELELLVSDGTLETLAQSVRRRRHRGFQRALCASVLSTTMLPLPMPFPEQLPEALLERRIAVWAAEPPGLTKVAQRRRAERAPYGIGLRRRDVLLNRLQKVGYRGRRGGYGRLQSSLGGALLAKPDLTHSVPVDLGDGYDHVVFLANLTQHRSSLLPRPARFPTTFLPSTDTPLAPCRPGTCCA